MENEEPARKPCPECGKEVTWTQAGKPRSHKCEPKEVTVTEPAKPGTITPDVVIAAYIKTRDEISALNAQIKGMNAKQAAKEQWLAQNMTTSNEIGMKTLSGSCHFNTVASVKTEDWERFFTWVHEDLESRKHFFERRVSKDATKQFLEEENVLPPGVGYTTIKKVVVKRPS